jgi:hypothetical protein
MKQKGTFKCEGCSQIFCSKHSLDHRYQLTHKLEEIELARDLIYQTFIQQYEHHSLLDRIEQWEQKSIMKIHQSAEEARQRILEEKIIFEQKLKDITNQLRQAREDDDFIEMDFDQWIRKLDELEKELLHAKNILIEDRSTLMLRKIRTEHEDTSDIFQYVCGDIQIKENGYLIVKDDWVGFSEVLGKKEYLTGQHTHRFQIKNLRENGWILVGIISKSESMNINSYNLPSSYGWTTRGQFYIAGQYHKEQKNDDIIQNDIITLIIDCDQRKIQMKNERIGLIKELSIDINKCPFPWKLHFNLLTALTSIRILPTLN